MMDGIDQKLISEFIEIVGEKNALTPKDDLTRYTHENRDIIIGNTPLVLKPKNTDEVSRIVKLANAHKTPIVPQGGHTGHAAGAVPDESGQQIVVSLERMNSIREVDLEGNTAIVEAGVVLQNIQEMAAENNRMFPLSLASQGSCQIGGNISTNAGGIAVISYGNTRDMVLGLEVVTPSGEIWNGLRRLKKDNTGYDLRDLFIGAEGTLGIITAAVVKLFPKPKGRVAALVGLSSPKLALKLLNRALEAAGKSLTGFEFFPDLGMKAVLDFQPALANPLTQHHDWYVLMEISSGQSEEHANGLIEQILSRSLEESILEDAAISQNESQRNQFWQLRETMPASQKLLGGSVKNDISIPVHLVPEFLEKADMAIQKFMPRARIFSFGHLGDGNVHYNISQPEDMETDAFLRQRLAINDIVNEVVISLNGSISAEHGIGRLKRDLLAETKSAVELEMMRSIKSALDPNDIMNPGKVI